VPGAATWPAQAPGRLYTPARPAEATSLATYLGAARGGDTWRLDPRVFGGPVGGGGPGVGQGGGRWLDPLGVGWL
jgi:hypothetical protein